MGILWEKVSVWITGYVGMVAWNRYIFWCRIIYRNKGFSSDLSMFLRTSETCTLPLTMRAQARYRLCFGPACISWWSLLKASLNIWSSLERTVGRQEKKRNACISWSTLQEMNVHQIMLNIPFIAFSSSLNEPDFNWTCLEDFYQKFKKTGNQDGSVWHRRMFAPLFM